MKSRFRFVSNLAWACGLLVSPASASTPFGITVNYTGDPAYQPYFTAAEAYWERIIPTYKNGSGFTGITINAEIKYIDGMYGILGSAGPTYYSTDSSGYSMATAGTMRFDSADVGAMGSNLEAVIVHEMAHVLGFGTLWDENNARYVNGVYTTGSGEYKGPAGLAAFKAEFNQPAATYVPVELGGGSGTANGHWNEVDGGSGNTGIVSSISGRDMRYELMTGWIDPTQPYFVSNLTRGSFQDIGYNAQLAAAVVWNSTSNDGSAGWGTAGNWTGGVPTAYDLATFSNSTPIQVTLSGGTSSVDTLQLNNSASVVIKDGTLNVWNINSTGSPTTTFQNVTVGAKPDLTVANGTLKFVESNGTTAANVTATNVFGQGTIQGNLTIEGTHSVAGIGTVGTQAITNSSSTSSNLTYANGSVFEWDLASSSTSFGFDKVSVTGNIAVGTDTIFRVVLGGSALSDILDPDNAFWNTPSGAQNWSMSSIFGEAFSSGWFSNVQFANNLSSYGSFSITPTNLVWNAVPEMTTLGSGFLLLLGAFRRRRES